jgi:prepilin-type N-terminal cleavage/methylation domain-containing protein
MKKVSNRGWSLAEVLVVAAILGLFIALAFPGYRFIRAKMNFAVCVGNLKSIHAGLSVYLQDHAMVWPQYPHSLNEMDEDDEDRMSAWWYETLKPYGVPRKTWICPGDRDGQHFQETRPETFLASYGVTLFDETPNNAYRWFQPWVVENGQNHGTTQGPNLIMPDGEVRQGVGISVAPPPQ